MVGLKWKIRLKWMICGYPHWRNPLTQFARSSCELLRRPEERCTEMSGGLPAANGRRKKPSGFHYVTLHWVGFFVIFESEIYRRNMMKYDEMWWMWWNVMKCDEMWWNMMKYDEMCPSWVLWHSFHEPIKPPIGAKKSEIAATRRKSCHKAVGQGMLRGGDLGKSSN